MNDTLTYDFLVNELRTFFRAKNYIEVPVQSRLSILAACEDPFTVSKFTFSNQEWPLPQTGQMWLEHELLTNPEFEGVYCISTSYRNEPNPIEGRHDLIFQMFEFEGRGGFEELIKLEIDLLCYLGIKEPTAINNEYSYSRACEETKSQEIGFKEEEMLCNQEPYCFLTHFPRSSNPFWNMKQIDSNTFEKIDVLIGGIETIGSAVRETDPKIMRANFYSITDGQYAKEMFDNFGTKRVMKELNEYLDLPMTPRFGGGIGLTRLSRYIQKRNK